MMLLGTVVRVDRAEGRLEILLDRAHREQQIHEVQPGITRATVLVDRREGTATSRTRLVKPRRTQASDKVFRLPGGTEDNDLWVTTYDEDDVDQGGPAIGSTWEPTDDERQAIADGANVELIVWGTGHPPVALRLSPYALGKAPATGGDGG